MRKRAAVCVVMVQVLILVAMSAAGADNQQHPRPIWGKLRGEATFPSSDACLEVTGAPWQTLGETAGWLTRLGRTKLVTSHCSTFDGSAAVHGLATFTAANGDQVWTAYTATTVVSPSPPGMLIIQETEHTVVGGTGRFEGASGFLLGMVYVTYEGLEDPSWPLEFVLTGTIIY